MVIDLSGSSSEGKQEGKRAPESTSGASDGSVQGNGGVLSLRRGRQHLNVCVKVVPDEGEGRREDEEVSQHISSLLSPVVLLCL